MEQHIAIVTGAAGGIGSAVARQLAADGYEIVVVDREDSPMDAVVDQIAGAGGTASALAVDLRDEDDVAAKFASIPGQERLRVLVNVAGLISIGAIADVSVEHWDAVLGVKLRGDFLICKAVIPALIANRGGAIVNIASMSGRTKSVLTAVDYVSSNAGVIGFTMTLAAQNAKHGIRVNCVAPGMVQTPMLAAYSDDELDAIRASVPMGRFADPAELANAVSFLVSDKASYITGETLNVNGGMFMV